MLSQALDKKGVSAALEVDPVTTSRAKHPIMGNEPIEELFRVLAAPLALYQDEDALSDAHNHAEPPFHRPQNKRKQPNYAALT